MTETEFSTARHMTGVPFKNTNTDKDGQHFTQGIIALGFRWGVGWDGPNYYTSVLHQDDAPVLGSLDRIVDLAQEFADDLGKPVYLAEISQTGGHSTQLWPREKSA